MAMVREVMKNNAAACSLTDLHTHILPSFDDGAKNLKQSLHMLCVQKESGVDRVVLTPHYYPLWEDVTSFVDRRQCAYSALLSQWDAETMPQLRLGAEVCYTPQLVQMDLTALTMGESRYLLLELPDTGIPVCVEQVVYSLLLQGIVPILAHVERCAYFRAEPAELERLVRMGALAQVDARAVLKKSGDSFAKTCFKKELAQILASDAHNLVDRRPCLTDAFVEQNAERMEKAEKFAYAVWENTTPPAFEIQSIRKGIFGYR